MKSIVWITCLAMLFLACGGTSTGSRTSRFSNVITAEEISKSGTDVPMRNAYDVIQYLRPNFLKVRGATSSGALSTNPVVYVNNIRFGSIDALRNIYTDQIKEIRYLSPADASLRFGSGHSGGAILITLK
ncbi:MAG: hypothetical protein D6814_00125 [Calditrichaeota bacterium]|nr:MAG: hypothetical protein D6814_00125 [Calditrichota bacterium]